MGVRMSGATNSLVVPVYNNARSVDALIDAVEHIAAQAEGGLEAIFVVDGSPDDSYPRLLRALAGTRTEARIALHSRNFGAFAAIRTGMRLASGRYIAVMAADLQEPPELIVEFFARLARHDIDVVVGKRASRDDRGDSASTLYWRLYRRFVLREIPSGGVDVFGCTDAVRDVVCSLEDVHTSLVAQLFWVGFRRGVVSYDRRPRSGKSSWTFRSKTRYLADSIFAFTDLPVKILWMTGLTGMAISVVVGSVVLTARAFGIIPVPGFAATALILLFVLGANSLGLGIIGSYAWRAYEGTKGRPGAIVREVIEVVPAPEGVKSLPEGNALV